MRVQRASAWGRGGAMSLRPLDFCLPCLGQHPTSCTPPGPDVLVLAGQLEALAALAFPHSPVVQSPCCMSPRLPFTPTSQVTGSDLELPAGVSCSMGRSFSPVKALLIQLVAPGTLTAFDSGTLQQRGLCTPHVPCACLMALRPEMGVQWPPLSYWGLQIPVLEKRHEE